MLVAFEEGNLLLSLKLFCGYLLSFSKVLFLFFSHGNGITPCLSGGSLRGFSLFLLFAKPFQGRL
jgi:hypothetical protein